MLVHHDVVRGQIERGERTHVRAALPLHCFPRKLQHSLIDFDVVATHQIDALVDEVGDVDVRVHHGARIDVELLALPLQ